MNFDVGIGKEASESELPALEQLVAMGYEYKTQAELNKFLNTRYLELICKSSKLTMDTILMRLNQVGDWYFTAPEALEMGIITKIY